MAQPLVHIVMQIPRNTAALSLLCRQRLSASAGVLLDCAATPLTHFQEDSLSRRDRSVSMRSPISSAGAWFPQCQFTRPFAHTHFQFMGAA